MAKTKKASAGKGKEHGNDLLESPEALAEQLTRTEEFIEKNRQLVFAIGAVIILGVTGFIFYNYYQSNQNTAAQKELFQAVYYFEADSLGQALNGDGNNYGFLDIIDLYGSTKAGNLANFYAGATYLKMGDFESAIRYLKSFGASDDLVQARAYSLIGDAYMEQLDYKNAADYYQQASDYKPNKQFTPVYLTKAAIAYERQGDLSAALKCYTTIVDKFYGAAEYQDAKKHKARLEALASK
jgi:tetratricopeptide (TPR) repeat protein